MKEKGRTNMKEENFSQIKVEDVEQEDSKK